MESTEVNGLHFRVWKIGSRVHPGFSPGDVGEVVRRYVDHTGIPVNVVKFEDGREVGYGTNALREVS